jgi:hypothetical protein
VEAFARLWLLVLLGLCVACAPVLHVYKDEGGKINPLKGVPFRTKVPQYVQRTVRQETWYEMTISLHETKVSKLDTITSLDSKKDPPKVAVETVEQDTVLREIAVNAKGLQAIRDARNTLLASSNSTAIDAFLEAVDAVAKNPDYSAPTPETPIGNRTTAVTSNSVTTEWIASDQMHYLNGGLPWFGSASVSTELGPDGSLSKAEGQTESKAGDVIASVLPLKEFFTKRWGLVAPEKTGKALLEALTPTTVTDRTIKIAAEERGYFYTVTARFASNPSPFPGPLALDGTHDYVRSSLDAVANTKPEKSTPADDESSGKKDK